MSSAVSLTDHEFDAAARAMVRMIGFWGLSDEEASAALGVDAGAWDLWNEGTPPAARGGELPERMSLMLGVHRGMSAFFDDNRELGGRWLRAHNPALGGTPVSLMASLSGLRRVRDHLLGLSQGG